MQSESGIEFIGRLAAGYFGPFPAKFKRPWNESPAVFARKLNLKRKYIATKGRLTSSEIKNKIRELFYKHTKETEDVLFAEIYYCKKTNLTSI